MINQNSTDIYQVVKYFSVVFFILNSLQISSAFLLIASPYPQQYYEVLRILSSFTYKQIPPWQTTLPYAPPQVGLGISVPPDYFPAQVPTGQFVRLGFSHNVLVNIGLPLAQLFVAWSLFGVARELQRRARTENAERTYREARNFLFSLVLKLHESTFLPVSVSILLQLQRPNAETVFNLLASLLAALLLAFYALVHAHLYAAVNKNPSEQSTGETLAEYGQLLDDLQFVAGAEDGHAQDAAEAPRAVRWAQTNYHALFGFLKKCLVSLVLVALQFAPGAQQIALCVFHAAMFALTARIRPYLLPAANLVKVTADGVLVLLCLLNAVVHFYGESLYSNPIVTTTAARTFIAQGWIGVYLLLVFHTLHFLLFCVDLALLVRRCRRRAHATTDWRRLISKSGNEIGVLTEDE